MEILKKCRNLSFIKRTYYINFYKPIRPHNSCSNAEFLSESGNIDKDLILTAGGGDVNDIRGHINNKPLWIVRSDNGEGHRQSIYNCL